jgi:hypothetical protein
MVTSTASERENCSLVQLQYAAMNDWTQRKNKTKI